MLERSDILYAEKEIRNEEGTWKDLCKGIVLGGLIQFFLYLLQMKVNNEKIFDGKSVEIKLLGINWEYITVVNWILVF